MLDHGILNVPLHKRGNINIQLDKHMAEKRKQEAERLDEIKNSYDYLDTMAKHEYSQLTKDQIKWFANKIGATMKDARIELQVGTPQRRMKLYKVLRNG